MARTMPAMTPDQEPACAGEPLFFPGLRALPRTDERVLGRGGLPSIFPALPPYVIVALFAADEARKVPGM
jgi:hypothetical protein